MSLNAPGTIANPQASMSDSGKSGPRSSDLASQWAEARLAYPLYAALASQFGLAQLPHPANELPPVRPTRSVFEQDLKWLDDIDERVLAYQIRQLSPNILNSNEETLRAVIHRQLRKPDKTTIDRDKIDLLLVQYFALCAPEELYRGEIGLHDVARVLQPVLHEADATPLEWCEPLETILASLNQCRSLRDLMEGGLLEQGRLLKDAAGCMFYDPAALVAFCRFNFLLRRAFIRLLHADLKAVRETIQTLDEKGVKTVDCRRAGFSAAETTTQLRAFCEDWRQPFQKDYTESSVNRVFEQLLALRTDLEEALGKRDSRPGDNRDSQERDSMPPEQIAASGPADAVQSIPTTTSEVTDTKQPMLQSPVRSFSAFDRSARPIRDVPVSPTGSAEADKCLEAIWEQLIDAPPSRGRSMSTVVLQDTKVLLSSWEVAAFVSEGGQESDDLRRAVVARALLCVAMDLRKRSGEENALASALALAHSEVSYFQGRVEQAKHAKKAEAAVNLGISTKRLLSFMEEAEQLLP